MKKKIIIIFGVAILCILTILLILNLTDCATICVEGNSTELSVSDSFKIRSLLMIEKTDFIGYGCGFSTDRSIQVGGLTYCLSQDGCNSIYIPELNFYYTISKDNYTALEQILRR